MRSTWRWSFCILIGMCLCLMLFGCATQQQKKNMIPKRLSTQKKEEITKQDYQIFNASGQPTTLKTIVDQMERVDVVLLGESHNDFVAHYIQEKLLKKSNDRYWQDASSKNRRPIVLSMEMFARDVQMILDEYLLDIINEKHFLACARPWPNYLRDYHALVKYAKTHNIKVIAANAPRRYIHRVAQAGESALNDLSNTAKTWIAPLPCQGPSDQMKEQFHLLQRHILHAHKDISDQAFFLSAQNLWDATMAHSISEELINSNPLVIHLAGNYHTQYRIGIPEHLVHYRPKVRMMIICIIQNTQFPNFDPLLKDCGDFIIITDPKKR